MKRTADKNSQGFGSILFLSIVGGLFVLAGIAYMVVSRQPGTQQEVMVQTGPTPMPSAAAVDTSGWKIYRNEQYGFEMKYPGDWKATPVLHGVIELQGPSGSAFDMGQSLNDKNLNLDSWFDEYTLVEGRPSVKRVARREMLNGRPIYKIDGENGAVPPLIFEIYIANDRNEVLSLDGTSMSSAETVILNQILFTFKFTK